MKNEATEIQELLYRYSAGACDFLNEESEHEELSSDQNHHGQMGEDIWADWTSICP